MVTKGKNARFRQETLAEVERLVGKKFKRVDLERRGFSTYDVGDSELGLVCIISKTYEYENEAFWFSFYPYQKDFIDKYKIGIIALGLGSPKATALLPRDYLFSNLQFIRKRESESKEYWFLQIAIKGGRYMLQTIRGVDELDVTKFVNKAPKV